MTSGIQGQETVSGDIILMTPRGSLWPRELLLADETDAGKEDAFECIGRFHRRRFVCWAR